MYQGANIKRKRNPRERANWLQIVSFFYTIGIFKKSRKRDLIEDDIYEPLKECETHRVGDRLQQEWEKEIQLGRNSLTRALIRVFGKSYFLYGFAYMIVKCAITTINPLMMGRLVSFFSPTSTMERQEACFYGGVLIFTGFIQSAFNNQYLLLMSTLGIKIKASLVSLIYRKSLKLTASSLMEITSGKLVTLISKDALAFETAISNFHDLWIGLLQLVIMSYIMYQQIQEATFVGITFLLVLIPLQVYIANYTKIMRLKTSTKTDERLKSMQEMLTSIKLLKMYNWVEYYTKLTINIRIEEIKKLRIIYYLRTVVLILSLLCERVSFYISILYYIYMGNLITAEQVFVVIDSYGNLGLTLAIPQCVSNFADARSAIQRIKHCLLIDDIPCIPHNPIAQYVRIRVVSAQVNFGEQGILNDIHFRAQSPSLIGVTGTVGSGKSTFLKMLLNDVHVASGSVSVEGSVSYASQEPWLFPGTIKQNILFGQPCDEERYQEVLRCCALLVDLEGFPMKDNTIVNDKGLNLSKGQQARINLARAVYKPADIYLLDDVMVSLDARVCKYLFENCIQHLLKDKLVVFVCHNKKYLKQTNRVVVLGHGRIQAEGEYRDLLKEGVDFTVDNINLMIGIDSKIDSGKVAIGKSDEEGQLLTNMIKDDNQRLYLEHKQEGKVKWDIYKTYLDSAGGWKVLFLIIILFVIAQLFSSYFDYYASDWLKIEERLSGLTYNISHNLTNLTYESDEFIDAEKAHIGTIANYLLLVGMTVATISFQLFAFFSISINAAKRIHNNVFKKVVNATMSFFDANLSGNILNRFSKDIDVLDEVLPGVYFITFKAMFYMIGTSAVIGFVTPMLIAPTLIMLGLMVTSRMYFLKTSRGLKRLDGSTRAPVIGILNSSLEGLTTVRASGNQRLLTRQLERHQDLNTSALFMYLSITRAFAFWMDTICKAYIAFMIYSSIFFVNRGEGSAGKVGVAITQAFGLIGLLEWGIREWAELENQMTSVERVNEYSGAEQEKLTGLVPDNWPLKGNIEYRNVSLSYVQGQRILKNVSFAIKHGERVGVIGRTGAGKSSIISALFRLYEIEGSIIIDDNDIQDIDLSALRSRISIIPQDPVLFGGTIRTNLDPDGQFTDMRIWSALGEVELKSDIESLKQGLSSIVHEGGGNFSVGQRQLICLARAILTNNLILVLDEATANIDPKTDELLQKTIKKLFSHCTILTIAHRLHTVFDSDRIIVVDNGEVVDYDTPQMLTQRGDGIFYNMAKEVGLVN